VGPRVRLAVALLGLAIVAAALVTFVSPSRPHQSTATSLHFASLKGLNYGIPLSRSGAWLGTSWLRSGTGVADHWSDAYPQIVADLDFVQQHHLGRVIRLFIGLDQLMEWNDQTGFTGFHEQSVANFQQVVSLFAARDLQMVAVLYDQEETGSPGNFHFQALDGQHPAMRSGYLRATQLFLARFGSLSTIVAWDLFNEAYGSLGPDGGHPRPPASDPVSPNYPDTLVHAFLHDLYGAAKGAAPQAWFTVSDGNLYVQPVPDLSRFDDILDFYDVHIYDDHPAIGDLRGRLDKPFIVGEAGASLKGDHLHDQRIEPGVVRDFLDHAQGAGALAMLIHSISDQNVFPATHTALTPAGTVLASFDSPVAETAEWPIVHRPQSTVLFVQKACTGSLTVLSAPGPGGNIRPGGNGRWTWVAWPYPSLS
jgi:hypothetical protein